MSPTFATSWKRFDGPPAILASVKEAASMALFREMEMTWWVEQAEGLGKEFGTL